MTNAQLFAAESKARLLAILAGPGSGKTTTIIHRAKCMVESGVNGHELAFVTFTNSAARVLSKRLEEAGIKSPGFVGTLHGMMLRLLRSVDSRWTVIDDEVSLEYIAVEAKILDYKGSASELMAARAGASTDASANRVIRAYRARMREWRFLDTDSILVEGLAYVEKHRVPWSHLFVDEYQDTGAIDHQIYRVIAETCCMTIVGDSDQSIYSFRGARPENLTEFWTEDRFERHMLEHNFRSAIAICSVANAIVKLIPNRLEKQTIPASKDIGDLALNICASEAAELQAVVEQLSSWREAGTLPKNVAILSFTNAQCESIRETIVGYGIPVSHSLSTRRPKGWNTLVKMAQIYAAPENWGFAHLFVRDLAKAKKENTDTAVNTLRAKQAQGLTIQGAIDLPLWKTFVGLNANLGRFGITPATYSAFADVVRLWKPETPLELVEALQADPEAKHEEGVTVTTIHDAKGGEWDKVIVTGAEQFRDDSAESLRLLFVAVTRARHALTVTAAQIRMRSEGRMKVAVPWNPNSKVIATIKAVAASAAAVSREPVTT